MTADTTATPGTVGTAIPAMVPGRAVCVRERCRAFVIVEPPDRFYIDGPPPADALDQWPKFIGVASANAPSGMLDADETVRLRERSDWSHAYVMASGWPRLAVRGQRMELASSGLGHDEGVLTHRLWQPTDGTVMWSAIPGRFTVPLIPIWGGLLTNSLLVAPLVASAYAAWLAALGWRERFRRRRGLCPRCGYACGGTKCPECGLGAGNATSTTRS